MGDISKEVSITLLLLDPLNSNKNLHNFELLIFGSWTLFLNLIEYEDDKKLNFLISLNQIESFYYYEFLRWLIIWVDGYLRLSVSRLAATLGSYPAVEWTVPVEDALAPAVLPLLHQADDVPLLNKQHQRIFRCTVRVHGQYVLGSEIFHFCA